MIRIKLFGLAIRIHYLFWILCILLGLNHIKLDTQFGFIVLGILVATIIITLIWHDLGHVIFRKKYGAPYSEITLGGSGSVCSGPGQFTRTQRIIISIAGPVFSLILGGLIFLLTLTPYIENPYVDEFVRLGVIMNIGWAIISCLPIIPLDGGRILQALTSREREGIVPWVGLLLALLATICGGLTGRWPGVLLFGLAALQNWKLIRSGSGGVQPPTTQEH